MLVPNVVDMGELGYHIRIMFYITAGVTTALLILVVIGKTYEPSERGPTIRPLAAMV